MSGLMEVDQHFGTACYGHAFSLPTCHQMSYAKSVNLHHIINEYSECNEITLYIRPRKAVMLMISFNIWLLAHEPLRLGRSVGAASRKEIIKKFSVLQP